jgi:predicted outer membrane repeat protein
MDAGNNCLAEAAPCATVQRAVDVANEGEKVVIASGLYTQSTTLYKPVSLTGVNSATTILHAVEGQRVLTVTGATISNSVVISGLTFTGGSADYGGGMLITDTAQPLIRDSSFISNAANVGGGQYSSNAVTLINTDFISNTANLLGGGVHAFGEPVNITGGRFEANTGVSGGGLSAGGTVTLTNVDFIHNTASTGPGGALIGQGSVVSGGRFVENSAESIGGLSAGSNLIIAGTEFLSNTARTGAGGGLLVSALGTVVITGAQFENNYAGDSGGGLLVADTDVTLINTRFISNTSTREGGGVLLNNSKMAWISGGRFERNTATNGGGGVYAGFAAITDTEFINNTNTGEGFEGSGGGGLYSRYDPTIINSRFVGNQCVNCKGGGFHTLGNSIISGTAFIDNSATNGGGGAYTSRASIENSRFQRNTSANAEGGGLNAWILSVSSSQFISNSGGSGGGIFAGDLTYPSSLAVTRTVFSENSATRGGGLYVIGTAIITDAKFTNNSTAYQGGAIDFYRGQGRLINTLFVRNSAPVGAAISFESPENIAILHGTIVNPTSTTDSAIAVLSGTLNITNTIITNHAIAIGNTGGTVYEDYNLFFGNVTNTLGVTNGGHSLIGDPRFVDPADGDYHLRLSSPAIDHGVDAGVTTDLDGHPRPIGAGFDIGAYEYQGAITHVFLPLMRK